MLDDIISVVVTILAWELGKFIESKLSWWYKVRRGKAAKIITSEGGILTIIADKEIVKEYVEKYSKV